jgi:hypothetical protein
MSELAAVGLASSIVTFVEVSSKVLHRLHEYHSTARDAPGHFRETAEHLEVVVDILQRTKRECDNHAAAAAALSAGGSGGGGNGSLPAPADAARLASFVDGCRAHVATLGSLIDKLLPDAGDSAYRRTRKALASVWREKDVLAAQRRLATSLQLLTLYFSQRSAAGVDALATAAASAMATASGQRADDSDIDGYKLLHAQGRGLYDVPPLRVAHMVERPKMLEALAKVLKTARRQRRRRLLDPEWPCCLASAARGRRSWHLTFASGPARRSNTM